MAEVLDFPSRETQAFAFLERELRRLLAGKGADTELIDFALTTLTDVYGEVVEAADFGFSVDLPPGISAEAGERLQQQIAAGVDGLRAHHHHLILTLAARLVLTEMRLFQHQRSEGTEDG